MPGVMTKKEYLRKKKSQPKIAPVKKAGAEVQSSVPVPILSDKEMVFQDPDLKTYSDSIVLDGRSIARVCRDGVLRTRDIALASFMQSKGYILINNEE